MDSGVRAPASIAWNQPMLAVDGAYVFGVTLSKSHILIAPLGTGVLDALRPRLTRYTVNKKTFRVPLDWDVDAALIGDMAAAVVGGSA